MLPCPISGLLCPSLFVEIASEYPTDLLPLADFREDLPTASLPFPSLFSLPSCTPALPWDVFGCVFLTVSLLYNS